MSCRTMVISFLALIVSSGAYAAQGEWTRFRGPDGSGISDAKTVPVQWTEKDYNWKVKLPGVGHSSPVVRGNRIFVTCGEPETGKRMILGLDAADGRIVWQRDYPCKTFKQHRDNSFASATPAVDSHGVVLTWTTPEEVVLLALDLEGRDLWRRSLGPFLTLHGSGSSPIIVEDLVVLANDQEDPKALPEIYGARAATLPSGKSFLIALDRKTGETRWRLDRRTSQAPYSTPCVLRPTGGRPEVILTSTANGITAVDAATGKIDWELDNVFRERCVGSPVPAPGLVIAGDGYGVRGTRYVAVRPGSRERGEKPTVAYEIKPPVPLVPTPLVNDGRLFLWGDDGVVACLDAAGGKPFWRERVGGSFYGSPVCVNNRLYCIARNGDVVVLAASDKFELLARVPLGEPSYATPAVSGGVMYLRTRSHLFSLGGK